VNGGGAVNAPHCLPEFGGGFQLLAGAFRHEAQIHVAVRACLAASVRAEQVKPRERQRTVPLPPDTSPTFHAGSCSRGRQISKSNFTVQRLNRSTRIDKSLSTLWWSGKALAARGFVEANFPPV